MLKIFKSAAYAYEPVYKNFKNVIFWDLAL
jgi:hypothetical protein